VFNQIHNIQPQAPPETVVRMFETILKCGGYPIRARAFTVCMLAGAHHYPQIERPLGCPRSSPMATGDRILNGDRRSRGRAGVRAGLMSMHGSPCVPVTPEREVTRRAIRTRTE
jgi:hypothetical protein